MSRRLAIPLAALFLASAASLASGAPPCLTIYNQNFAVVRVEVPLDLKAGINHVELTGITDYLEPDSVILRDPTGNNPFRIVEQNYRGDPVSQDLMLQLYEGKEIDFLVTTNGHTEVVHGKIVRAGYVPPPQRYYYPQPYGAPQPFSPQPRQPIIEVNGELRFSLPGEPLFPALTQGSILKPVLSWSIASAGAAHVDAELSYITEGLDWDATYNVIEPLNSQALNLLGWVTIHNVSGKAFTDAQVKLVAGTVNKLQAQAGPSFRTGYAAGVGGVVGGVPAAPLVTQQPFDEYHLYELHRPVTLRDRETKQVEFIRASGVQSDVYYVYDGLRIPPNRYNGWNTDMIRQNREFGTEFTRDVRVMREFVNASTNHLGIPLPAGRMRFYREDQDGNLEFLGENDISHTSSNDTVSVYTGSAFDLRGERTRTNYSIDTFRRTLDESFEIHLHNHKEQPVEIRVREHLYRGDTWEVTDHSNAFVKTDSHTIEFRVEVPPGGEKVVTYTVHYTW
ncbi:MAG: DUF4139 domain-containing protein [Terriglobia bacterium]